MSFKKVQPATTNSLVCSQYRLTHYGEVWNLLKPSSQDLGSYL